MKELLAQIRKLEEKAPGLDDLHHAYGGVLTEYLEKILDEHRIPEISRKILLDPWDTEIVDKILKDTSFTLHDTFKLMEDRNEFMAGIRRTYMNELDALIADAGPHIPNTLSYAEKSLVLLFNINRLQEGQQEALDKIALSRTVIGE